MSVQVIMRDGQAEYAVLPWSEYQALLRAAGQATTESATEQAKVALGQLKSLREAQGQSLEQLARTVGISPHYLGLIESGEREPDEAIKRSLARVLGVSGWESGS
ncbi:helix-turn-helix transcriptional regulator [Pseudomonas sp. JS3066]|jgi:DNA-binding XRE family transcriptional regulator|uniref:helix-turn-helix domain-containing protein n=1 Tax=unclassified Pseudomonas TaxID=196821 RepID=UPI00129D38F5|nr:MULTISPECIES: helix-turn-helix transcriptional regulator [unclassified Pseudomonas]MDH4654388.1 helix-turn-helix transcriptional regulator [Pseudomonas sp. BN606]MRK21176.1 helix-turn-helix transcriptional regulator [Pseudomonas sp. JG-B]WVK94343.1 helix-turn-helix transcriptional regulator [Pseudomonas sp. JS3066]